ncbi:hypothetical protein [Natrialba sp. SSL1]|uniref:hypothetical protein n=1 Tax=Natrialba sp. SSL1 TaxID=1869245 RepID=UPI0008F8E3BF|nr:hypothetical protein [Natrialba sp. SSL1]OIB55775.1 hypothetical protein BBD46_02900 [Natrialba sp. SSL1]
MRERAWIVDGFQHARVSQFASDGVEIGVDGLGDLLESVALAVAVDDRRTASWTRTSYSRSYDGVKGRSTLTWSLPSRSLEAGVRTVQWSQLPFRPDYI